MKLKLLFLFLFTIGSVYGQNNFLSIGTKKNGVCLGNSSNYNGIRLNLIDTNDSLRRINGLNLTVYQSAYRINGFSLGLFASDVLVSNGISVSGLYCGRGTHNGISITGLCSNQLKNNGLNMSLICSGQTYNGLTIGLWVVAGSEKINGLALSTFYVTGTEMNGVSFAVLHSKFVKQSGVSFSLFNKTDELHGMQFGLINYAGNNRKAFRWLPFVNFNFKNKKALKYATNASY